MTGLQTLSPVRRTDARHHFADDRIASPFHRQPVTVDMPRGRRIRPARRPSSRATERIRERMPLHSRVTPRRRLRREIRQVGYALMLAAPILVAMFLLRGLPGASPSGDIRARADEAGPPPSVSLIFDVTRPQPIILPGYVLPDDGNEESSHHAGS